MKTTTNAALMLFSLLSLLATCKEKYEWNLPPGIPAPVELKNNPMTSAKVELGRYLFYDPRLSQDETMSCGSCHKQALAFTDGRARGRGIPAGMGEIHPRSPQHLGNSAYYSMLTWANPVLATLEAQMRVPLFFTANAVKEMGLEGDQYLDRLRSDPAMVSRFEKAYGKQPPSKLITEDSIRHAIASFERSLLTFNSSYDRFKRGDETALTQSQRRGMDLFFGPRTHCSECHSGYNFAESTTDSTGAHTLKYRNNGLYSEADYTRKPENETGLREFTLKKTDEGMFRAPSLRNVAVTFPYMHDGSIACAEATKNDADRCAREALGRVIDHYASGGKAHPGKDPLVTGFEITPEERADLVAFLTALTDTEFLNNPAFSDPYQAQTATK